jgi:hypothetical protein
MDHVIWAFAKPSTVATLDKHRILPWLSETLNIPILYNGCGLYVDPKRIRTVIFGGVPSMFSGDLKLAAALARYAKYVIFVHTDYMDKLPKHTSQGKSPWRAAWRNRHKAGLPPPDVWSNLKRLATATPYSEHVNWNTVSFETPILRPNIRSPETVFYYGSWRTNRRISFDRHFIKPLFRTIVSGSDKFSENYVDIHYVTQIPRTEFRERMHANSGLGLYLEDEKQDDTLCLPNRFYEMLSAGLPIIFDPNSFDSLTSNSVDPTGFMWISDTDARYIMKHRTFVGAVQQRLWANVDYKKEETVHIKKLWKRYQRRSK